MQRETRISKRDYLTNKIEENVGNSKKLWDQLKKLGYSSKRKKAVKWFGKLMVNLVLTLKRWQIALMDSLLLLLLTWLTNCLLVLIYFTQSLPLFKIFIKVKMLRMMNLCLTPVNEDFIYKELCKLNPSKSTGTDNIPARFVKDAASVFKKPIGHIINFSIEKNVVPKDLKNARVVPLFKKNKRSEVGNYRPVSVLSVVSKILERAVYTQLEDYLVKKKLLFDFQSGFRSNFSTDSCLTYLTDYIKTQTSKGLYTGMLMLDLQKTFDTVDHDILCKKLKAMGIKSVDWFRSYLSYRNQIVNVNDTESDLWCPTRKYFRSSSFPLLYK